MSEVANVKVDVPKQDLKEEEAEANALLKEIEGFQVETQEDVEFVAGMLAEVKGGLKELEAKRTSITKPMNQALRAVNDLFRPAKQGWTACEAALKKLLAKAHDRAYKKQQAALKEAATASQNQDKARADAAMERAQESDFAPVEGVAFVHGFDYNIVDFEQIPREYLLVDDAKIKKVIKAHDGKISIPGIKIQRTTSVRSSAS